MTALFIDTNGKIKAGEFPEKPKEPPRHWAATGRWDEYEDVILPKYESAVQAALDNGVECEDQIHASAVLALLMPSGSILEAEPMKPYPIPYKMEVKRAMSCGFEGENLCALNEKDCPNHLHGTCQEKKLATLTLISNV